MKPAARLIIPVWGERYVSKVLSLTLPAVLARGNLPALREGFEVELVIVTESRLFDMVRSSRAFGAASGLCTVRLVPLDDLLTDVPGDYGMVLTYALFRGFIDLGSAVTETYLVLLNADFIISDGSLRRLGQLMAEGRRVIRAPSFRVVGEDAWPLLEALVDPVQQTLCVESRALARLALANKHPTVNARTVNQRISHLSWMDQYYWYVDERTLIGYQSPPALVAVKPERVVTEPVNFWDYAFTSEAAPSAEAHVICDSDEFFMIELQSRRTGQEMVRIGWISLDEIAKTESSRATKEHRTSATRLLTIHAGDLPPDIGEVAAESRDFMMELYRRMAPAAAPNIGHPLLSGWFEETKRRRRGTAAAAPQQPPPAPAGPERAGAANAMRRALRTIYRNTFGSPPEVGPFHPLWADLSPVARKISAWRHDGGKNVLFVSSSQSPLHRLLGASVDPTALLASNGREGVAEEARYDACICELMFSDLSRLVSFYAGIRPLMKDGGHVIVSIVKSKDWFEAAEYLLGQDVYPDLDVSQSHFQGTAATALLRSLYARVSGSSRLAGRPLARSLAVAATLIMLAPFVRLANAQAARRDSTVFSGVWTSLLIEFKVKRRRPREATRLPGRTLTSALPRA